MKFRITYLLVAMLMVAACDSVRVEPPVQYGEISVGLSELSVDVSTKAPDSYNVALVNPDDESQNKATTLSPGIQESFIVRYGTYNVYAEDCTEEEAEEGYGRMRIAGVSEDILLSDAAPLQNVNVACSVANAKVVVFYEETVLDKFEGLNVRLGDSGGRILDIPQTDVNTDIITWFNPTGEFTYSITGTHVETGFVVDKSFTRVLKAKDCIRITVRLVVPSGDLLPDIEFDVDIIDIGTSTGKFNPYI